MINHAYRMLYGSSNRDNPSQIYVDNSRTILLPDLLAGVRDRLTGGDPEQADIFAINCLKILDGSSYRAEVTKFDDRITYDLPLVQTPTQNMVDFMGTLLGVSPAALNYMLYTQELELTFRRSPTGQERVAALIVGYIDQVDAFNA